MVSVVMTVVAVVVAVWCCGAAQLTDRVIQTPHLAFSDTDASEVYTLATKCKCRMMCVVRTECAAWSALPPKTTGEGVECRLIDAGPQKISLYNHTDALYGYKLTALESKWNVHEEDDLLYMMPLTLATSLQQMREYCHSIPGFRLLMLKTTQQQEKWKTFANLCPGGLLDLVKVEEKKLQWGDGTAVPADDQSNVAQLDPGHEFYKLTVTGIISTSFDNPSPFMCQGNDKMMW